MPKGKQIAYFGNYIAKLKAADSPEPQKKEIAQTK